MNKRRPSCLPLLIVLPFFSNPALCQTVKPLTLYTEDLPPYNMTQNGHVTGISSELIATALDGLQIGFTMRLVSWQRAYHEALTDPNSCVYSTVRTPEREELFQWIGPIGGDALGAFVLPDSTIQAHSLADLRGLRTVIRGVSRGEGGARLSDRLAFERATTPPVGVGQLLFGVMRLARERIGG